MARKLHDIASYIRDSENKFRDYLESILSKEVLLFLGNLSQEYGVYLFSGIIRDFFLKRNESRDVDLFVDGEKELMYYLKGKTYVKNNFGGYKVKIGKENIDIWELNNTWAIKNDQLVMDFDVAKYIPHTAFFNFSSIMFDLNKNTFYFTKHFVRFLRDKEIDIVYMSNPNPALCIVNTFYYSEKYQLKIASALQKYILKMLPVYSGKLEAVQEKHFGSILYTKEKLLDFSGEEIYRNKV